MSERLLPNIVRLSPTSIETWSYCPRRYLNRHVLGVPESDAGASSDHGLRMHELLRFVHERGTCHDLDFVAATLQDHGSDADAIRTMFERHRQRCPRAFDDQAHEIERSRYYHRPPVMYLASARVDAVWVHDGIMDVRDYKTGSRRIAELRDDVAAQVQAWVWAPRAQRRSLRFRLRYEYLAPEVDDDPDPWEPDADDIEVVGARLAAQVTAIRRSDFAGVNEAAACGFCPYRSICPDSAATGEASWPALALG